MPEEEADKPQPKPLLTAEQQIAHMKSKGITFDLCSEEEAATYLRDKCQFFRVYAYRKSFDKHVGGKRDGQYANLDFGHLRALSGLDCMLRDALLPMTLDIEHFAKVRLLVAAEDHGEDGYSVMHDYLASASERQRSYLDAELDRRERDPYVGTVVRKYRDNIPVWAFCEAVPLGAFSGLVKFCAERWADSELDEIHYLLKYTRSVRNFTAHGACSLNELSGPSPAMRPPAVLVNALKDAGISRRLRSKWLKGARMVQMCAMLYLYNEVVPDGAVRSRRVDALQSLFDAVHGCLVPPENQAIAALLFAERLTVALGLLR